LARKSGASRSRNLIGIRVQVGTIDESNVESQSPVIRDYSERDYRRNWQKPSGEFAHRFERGVIQSLLPDAAGWWVDVGAGYGRVLPLYRRPDRKIVLVDYAINLLEMAAAQNPDPNIHLVAANAYHLPFRDRSFNSAISIHTFAHINAPDRFLGELARVVRDDSHLVVEYPNKRSFARVLKNGRRSFEPDREEYGDLFFGTHSAYFAELCERAGLRVLKTRGSGYLARVLDRLAFLDLPLRAAEFVAMNAPLTRSMAPRNFAQLRRTNPSENGGGGETPETDDILNILACPVCGGALAEVDNESLSCQGGGHEFGKNGRIFDLRYSAGSELRP
jgi:ubiquinone/menaquinone biosynthesis C-methylase UbiE